MPASRSIFVNLLKWIFILAMGVMLTGLLIVGPIWLTIYGGREIVLQDQLISAARPVEARVLSSKMVEKVIRGSKSSSTHYIPTVWYRYSVNGVSYEGRRATPREDVTSKSTAEPLIQAHPLGSTQQAWYLPDDPSQSFLIRWYSGWPYVYYFCGIGLMTIPIALLAHGMFHSMFVRRRRARRTGAAAPQFATGTAGLAGVPRTLDALLTDKSRGRYFQGTLFLALTWLGGWHALTRLPADDQTLLRIALTVYTLVSLLYFYFAMRVARIARVMSDARVFIDPPVPRIGQTFVVRVEQDLRQPVEISEMRIGVVCMVTTGRGKSSQTKKHVESWHTQPSPRPVAQDAKGLAQRVAAMEYGEEASIGVITASAQFILPADAPPTSSDDAAYTRYDWGVYEETLTPACPKYAINVALEVRAM